MPSNKLKHLVLPVEHINADPFSPKQGGGGGANIPRRFNRKEHATKLHQQLENIKNQYGEGVVFAIKFEGQAGKDLLFTELEKSSFNMELLSIKEENGVVSANVRVDSTKTFEKLFIALSRYSEAEKETSMLYISSIEDIKNISVEDFFTDDISLLPDDDNSHWWEIWLTNKNVEDPSVLFIRMAENERLIINNHPIKFSDRTVFLCQAKKSELSVFLSRCNLIAEIRIAKKLKKPLAIMGQDEQEGILDSLLGKIVYPDNDNTRIVVLDGNYIVRHPLLDGALIRNQQADSRFSLNNTNEHATEMGSLALIGDISEVVNEPSIVLTHKIEGVQLFDDILNFPELYGKITENAVVITRDNENSAYVMPVGENNGDRHKGKPSSWSAYVDKISFNYNKLFAVAVGNINQSAQCDAYKQLQESTCVESPAQAWNALSVGSYTEMCNADLCSANGLTPYANTGEVSPYSRTSCLFDKQWPVKPEVLFEGGNKVVDLNNDVISHSSPYNLAACSPDALKGHSPFVDINATSASTGLAGKFIGELMAAYPSFWAETIRGLVVHSAEWTDAMLANVSPRRTKEEISKLAHVFGYGVPNINRAKYSASNALTLIAQKNFRVYDAKKDENGVPTKEKISQILLFPLPWPEDVLRNELRDVTLKLKITLSYFVEANPSERGYSSKYAYQSHNLRFDLQRPTENRNEFENRINRLIQAEEGSGTSQTDSLDWFYGSRFRSRGSVHKDILEINGAQLADMKHIAIYSVAGWWKDRKSILPEQTNARFSLIVDIDAGNTEVDLYTEIQTLIPTLITIPV